MWKQFPLNWTGKQPKSPFKMATNDTEFRSKAETLGIFISVVPCGIGSLWSRMYSMLEIPLHTAYGDQLWSLACKSRWTICTIVLSKHLDNVYEAYRICSQVTHCLVLLRFCPCLQENEPKMLSRGLVLITMETGLGPKILLIQ